MSRAVVPGLLACVAAGAVLRFVGLDAQSLWFDEAATRWLVGMSLGDMLDTIPESEQTPPLFYLATWVWSRVFGFGESALRFLPALAGTATIVFAWLAARRLVGPRAALGVAALTAASPVLVWYSQEARAYSPAVLLSTAALYAFVRAVQDERRRDLWAWALLSAVAVLTHYFTAFVFVAQAVVLLRRGRLRRAAAAPTAVVVVTGLAVAPLAEYQSCHSAGGFVNSTLADRSVRVVKQSVAGPTIENSAIEAFLLVTSGVGLLLLAGALVLGRTRLPSGTRLAAAVGGGAILLAVLAALTIVDVINVRNMLFAWPPVVVVLAAALAVAGRPARLATAGVALLVVAGTVSTLTVLSDERWHREDWRGLAEDLPPRDRVLVVSPNWGVLSVQPYFDGIGRVGAREVTTTEVVVAAMGVQGEIRVPPPLAPGDPAPPPPPGFTLAERVHTRGRVHLRYTAPRPVRLTRPDLRALALKMDEGYMALTQTPGAPDAPVSLSCDGYLI